MGSARRAVPLLWTAASPREPRCWKVTYTAAAAYTLFLSLYIYGPCSLSSENLRARLAEISSGGPWGPLRLGEIFEKGQREVGCGFVRTRFGYIKHAGERRAIAKTELLWEVERISSAALCFESRCAVSSCRKDSYGHCRKDSFQVHGLS